MIIKKKRYHFKGGGVMIEKLLDKLGYISKERLLTYIDINNQQCDKTIELYKNRYDKKEITKWNYYKQFWFQQGAMEGLETLEKYINIKE
jgi:hypothetical protein